MSDDISIDTALFNNNKTLGYCPKIIHSSHKTLESQLRETGSTAVSVSKQNDNGSNDPNDSNDLI